MREYTEGLENLIREFPEIFICAGIFPFLITFVLIFVLRSSKKEEGSRKSLMHFADGESGNLYYLGCIEEDGTYSIYLDGESRTLYIYESRKRRGRRILSAVTDEEKLRKAAEKIGDLLAGR